MVQLGMILIFIATILNFVILVTTQNKKHHIITIIIGLIGFIIGIIGLFTNNIDYLNLTLPNL